MSFRQIQDRQICSIQTTDATPTKVWDVVTVAPNTCVLIHALVKACSYDKSLVCSKSFLVRRPGVSTLVSMEVGDNYSYEPEGKTKWVVGVAINNFTMAITVAGKASTLIQWGVTIEAFQFSPW